MDDKEQIAKLYHDMYAAMVAKDEAELLFRTDRSFGYRHKRRYSDHDRALQGFCRSVRRGSAHMEACTEIRCKENR